LSRSPDRLKLWVEAQTDWSFDQKSRQTEALNRCPDRLKLLPEVQTDWSFEQKSRQTEALTRSPDGLKLWTDSTWLTLFPLPSYPLSHQNPIVPSNIPSQKSLPSSSRWQKRRKNSQKLANDKKN
jgi:hypothetical protein